MTTRINQFNIANTATPELAGLTMSGNITPTANITYDLGNTTHRWRDIWLSNSTIHIGNAQISANATGLTLTNPQGGEISLSGTTSDITADSITATGNISGGNLSGTLIAGTLTTTSQPNVTEVGTLTSLTVTGNISAGNIIANNVATLDGVQTLTNKTLGETTLSGNILAADNTINRSLLEDYAIRGQIIGNAGASRTLDLEEANFFSSTIDQACVFTFSNPPASGNFGCFVLELTNGGAYVITWPGAVDWPGGTAPTLTAAGVDQLIFTTRDAGTTWLGFVAGLDIKSP